MPHQWQLCRASRPFRLFGWSAGLEPCLRTRLSKSVGRYLSPLIWTVRANKAGVAGNDFPGLGRFRGRPFIRPTRAVVLGDGLLTVAKVFAAVTNGIAEGPMELHSIFRESGDRFRYADASSSRRFSQAISFFLGVGALCLLIPSIEKRYWNSTPLLVSSAIRIADSYLTDLPAWRCRDERGSPLI
jgi:hypothetical protein